MVDVQAVRFGSLLKTLVVVHALIAGVLDTMLKIVLVCHLVQEGGSGLLDGAGEGSRREVYLVLALLPCLPDFADCDVPVGGGGLFQADDRLRQLAVVE